MDISPFAFNRDQSGKYPYAALDEDIRSFTDAAFYCEVLRGVSAGSRVILCAGAEVQDALRRGQKSRRNQAVKEDLIKVYGEEVVNLPDYVFTKKSINYIAGPGKFNPMSYSFFTVRLPLQREDQATLLLPAHSFAKKLYSGLNNLLFQATALQAFFCPLKVARTAAEEKYCTHTMHQDIQTAPTEILNKFMRYVPKKKMTYDEYYYEAADVAEWMKK